MCVPAREEFQDGRMIALRCARLANRTNPPVSSLSHTYRIPGRTGEFVSWRTSRLRLTKRCSTISDAVSRRDEREDHRGRDPRLGGRRTWCLWLVLRDRQPTSRRDGMLPVKSNHDHEMPSGPPRTVHTSPSVHIGRRAGRRAPCSRSVSEGACRLRHPTEESPRTSHRAGDATFAVPAFPTGRFRCFPVPACQ